MLRSFAFSIALFATIARAEDKPSAELDGTYELREFTENGRGSDEKDKVSTVTFKDGLMSVKLASREDSAKFSIDATKKPAAINFKPTTAEAKTTLGIWKIEKGELTIIFSKTGPRPADFRGTGEGVVKLVMARATPPKKDK